MYKLLTTAAVIMAVATPSFAWTGAKELITNLNTVYTGVDGQAQFGLLSGNGGQLNTFLSDVNAGVTHISLTVDGSNNIIPTLNEGKSLVQLTESAGDLVNRVNFDLFHDTSPTNTDDNDAADDATGKYDSGTNYTSLAGFGIGSSTADSKVTNGTTGLTGADGNGLVGAKVNTIVTAANTINDGLINQDTVGAGAANDAFIAAYKGSLDETHYGVNIKGFNDDITEINGSINAASGASFFSNSADFAVDGNTSGNFAIGVGTSFEGNGINDGTTTYPTLLDWANGTNGVDN